MIATALLLVSLLKVASGLSLSYVFSSHQPRACFYIDVPHPANEVTLYYSVPDSGDQKNAIDMTFYSPHGAIMHTLRRRTHDEIKIKATESGEHSVCFTHSTSYTEKDLDLDVQLVKLEGNPELKTVEGPTDPAGALAKKLEKTAENLQRDLTDLLHTLRHLRNREKRNLDTVLSISSNIFGVSILEMLLIAGMSVLQVVVLKTFFTSSGSVRGV